MRVGIRAARNPLLKDVTRDYGYLEPIGMGVPRKIIKAMREHNGTEPDLVEDGERCVTFRIRVEADNQGPNEALWGGVTINFPTLASRDLVESAAVQARASSGQALTLRAPGELPWGFRDDGTFGKRSQVHAGQQLPESSAYWGQGLKPQSAGHLHALSSVAGRPSGPFLERRALKLLKLLPFFVV